MPTHLLLLDNNVPIQLIPLLRPHEATHTLGSQLARGFRVNF
jgi:hypothetical protein